MPFIFTQLYWLSTETSAKFHYGEGHPMKPARLALAHNLVIGYGLHKKMETYTQRRSTEDEMTEFHSEDYIEFLKRCVFESPVLTYFDETNLGSNCFDQRIFLFAQSDPR
jgi:acetoin utilization deacetylase AcuC-like enzyme